MMPLLIEPIEESAGLEGRSAERRILICAGNYLPGYKSGGPVRSVANLVKHLAPYFDFYVVTRDRDATDKEPYPGITPGKWYQVGNARVLYCSSVGAAILRRAFREVRPDVIVLGSFQDTFTILGVFLRRLGVFGDTPIVLAPRGEFSPGAMEIKRLKKRLYRYSAKLLGFHEGLLWQAMGPREKQEILQAAPARQLDPDSILVARSITDEPASNALHLLKNAGAVKLAFISRISEKKNLHFVLELLGRVEGKVDLDIFGPVDEKEAAYWERCRVLLERLPHNIKAEYRGSIEHAAVPQVLHDHHFFVLPTKGENYCHAAVESFLAGTPVILSNETPWIDLTKVHAGFDIPLNDPQKWVTALQKCVDMDQLAYTAFLDGAKEYGRRFSVEESVRQHKVLFETALSSRNGERRRP